MRILLCLASAAGGIGTHVADLSRSLIDAGHDVLVATDEETRGRFELPGETPFAVGAVREAARGVDVVHAHGFRAGLLAARAARWTPFVISLHNPIRGAGLSPRRLVGGVVARRVIRRAGLVTGASSDLVEDALALGARRAELAQVPSPRVPALLETPRTSWRSAERSALLAAHGLDPQQALVLTIARVAPQKGIDVLEQAAAEGAGQWALLGPGQEALATDGTLHLLGESRDVTPWLLAADVLVVPSEWEARALVVQEAMAAGTPVVARRVGGLPDLVEGCGLLVDGPQGESAAPIARAVAAVLDHPDRAAEAAERGRERARDWEGLEDNATRWTLRYRALADVT